MNSSCQYLLSTECPPVLFEMSYFENGVQIGGHPWHYIYTPNHKRHRGTHHICSITDGALVITLIPRHIIGNISPTTKPSFSILRSCSESQPLC